jgi:hypothetical protein
MKLGGGGQLVRGKPVSVPLYPPHTKKEVVEQFRFSGSLTHNKSTLFKNVNRPFHVYYKRLIRFYEQNANELNKLEIMPLGIFTALWYIRFTSFPILFWPLTLLTITVITTKVHFETQSLFTNCAVILHCAYFCVGLRLLHFLRLLLLRVRPSGLFIFRINFTNPSDVSWNSLEGRDRPIARPVL